MKRILLFLLLFSCVAIFANAAAGRNLPKEKDEALGELPSTATDTAIINEEPIVIKKNTFAHLWDSTRVIETPYYRVIIPSVWEKYPNMSAGVEFNYSLSGKELPATYNNSAVLVSFYISRQAGNSLADAVQRVKAARGQGAKSIKEHQQKANGWQGVMLESDYLQYLNGRDSKRYDLVIFSNKKGEAFTFSFVVLVKDSTGHFATSHHLTDYIEQIYNNIWILD